MGFSLKLFRSRATALPALYGYREVGHFLWEYAREPAIIRAIPTASVAQAREYMQRFCSNEGVPALWRTAHVRSLWIKHREGKSCISLTNYEYAEASVQIFFFVFTLKLTGPSNTNKTMTFTKHIDKKQDEMRVKCIQH